MSSNSLIHDIRNPLNTIAMNAELGKLSLQKQGDVDKALLIFDTILKECQVCSERLTELKASMGDSGQDDLSLNAQGNNT